MEETTQQEKQQVTRNDKGQFVKGVSGNPNGAPSGRNKALFEIEEAVKEFEKEKGVSYWKACTLIAMKLANEGNTTLLCKILDKFVASKNIHEIEGGLGHDRTVILQFGKLEQQRAEPKVLGGDAQRTTQDIPSV